MNGCRPSFNQAVIISMSLFFCLAFLAPRFGFAEDNSYVGTEGCSCHKNEIFDWEKSRHAKAFYLLEAGKRKASRKKAGLDLYKDYSNERRCIKCHVAGYGEKGGFLDMESTPEMSGVGCEMCHGPGSKYRELHKSKGMTFSRQEARAAGQLYGSIDPEVCKRCHEHKGNPFRPVLDEKYRLDMKQSMADARKLFHELYPLKRNH